MEKNLYIDASHPNETRVVLKSNGNIEDYEYESLKNTLVKNNIYLGKVSRVEPSLQAAFIDFGKERHGFLSFNDIQSDYYQIPKSDLEIIKKEEEKLREELSKKVEEKENENLAEGKLEIDDPIDVEKKELSTIKIFANSDGHSEVRKKSNIIKVKSVSLIDLLKFHNAPKIIDYMSIDTEGSELDILQNFPFDNYKFNLISVEHNYGPNREKLKELLNKNGYKPFLNNLSKWDDWFVPIKNSNPYFSISI